MPTMRIGDTPAYFAGLNPDAPALTDANGTITRAEFDRRTNRLARAYQALGVVEGDYVTIGLPNTSEFMEATMATWKLGATPQPVSHKLPARELQQIVEIANSRIALGFAENILPGRKTVPANLDTSAYSDAPFDVGFVKYLKAPTSGGSTGRPKLIVSTAIGELDPAAGWRMLESEETHLVAAPFYHNAPFYFASMAMALGSHLLIEPKFDAERTLALIDKHKVKFAWLVPTMLQRILRLDEDVRKRYDLSSLRMVLCGGAPLAQWIKDAWTDWIGPDHMWELYGGTEATGTTLMNGHEAKERRGSVGKLQPGAEMKVVGEDGRDLPLGETGEIYMRRTEGDPTYFYLGAVPKTLPGGWESIGDVGYIDADNYIYLADRLTDMIVSGGANIYPAEIENALQEHPHVQTSVIVGLPHPDLGHAAHAIIHATQSVTQDELIAHLAERLVRYKIPRTFEFVNEPLRDDSGKVRRTQLRAERVAKMETSAAR
ncbi:bile acid-coenzyme A ligase [Variibacter gotjawalensis]|uniref:Bile acid-coenzyme A ligase n=1 Tax=Variibacter gotjawalensis TaxID=1333996 RepID=A0A0S3PVL8_9BRAD|nr:AMP-binding protein [Variibacter gotjawalensis]NIK45778.1 bile acid-coenzyme A ligase [Variibacter gotjawalensis]RZS47702.1 bile acid-coenzyme A ligase [Variibacter gotjawalensis]BAT59955.1 bile acid-coenzyme A ligase [Variibacter gotjawalensis]